MNEGVHVCTYMSDVGSLGAEVSSIIRSHSVYSGLLSQTFEGDLLCLQLCHSMYKYLSFYPPRYIISSPVERLAEPLTARLSYRPRRHVIRPLGEEGQNLPGARNLSKSSTVTQPPSANDLSLSPPAGT